MRNITIQYRDPQTEERKIHYTVNRDLRTAIRELEISLNIEKLSIVSASMSPYEIKEDAIG